MTAPSTEVPIVPPTCSDVANRMSVNDILQATTFYKQ
jgi:hypothetical protein